MQTLPYFSFDTLVVNLVQNQNIYIFSVLTCNNAIVRLLSGSTNYQILYEFTIGADHNTKIELRRGGSDEILTSSIAPDVLSCSEQRQFVLKWQDSFIELLQTNANGRSIFSYTEGGNDYDMEDIHGLSVETGFGISGEWILPRLAGTYYNMLQKNSPNGN